MRLAWTKKGAALHIVKYTRYGTPLKRTLCGHKIDGATFVKNQTLSGANCDSCIAKYDGERSREFG